MAAEPIPAGGGAGRSFRANSAARFLSDSYLLATSLVAATITARVLGPSGKGFYSTLTLLTVLLVQFFNLGLGEAAIVLSSKGRFPLRTATSATWMAMVPVALAGAACCFVLSFAILRPDTGNERVAIVLATVLVAFNVVATTLVWFLVLHERIVLVAALAAFSATVTTAILWYLVAGAGYGPAGAVAAALVGVLVNLGAVVVALSRTETCFAPRWDGAYLRSAVRFGAAVQMSNLLVQMTGRLDLVLVYRLATPAVAGTYSVALTIGSLVGAVPIAFAFASFPRLAQLDDAEADAFTLQLFRMGAVAASGSAAVLAVLTPLLVPVIFGHRYSDSVAPGILLVVGGIFWSGQWILARAEAARGRPKGLFVSFALSFVIMVALDLVLIGPFGGTGAGAASCAGSVAGFGAAAWYYRGWDWREFVPTWADCTHLAASVRSLVVDALGRARRGSDVAGAPGL